MKTIRLNDRMWFGKYKNMRMVDILEKDKHYLDDLCSKGLINYDEKILEVFENRRIRISLENDTINRKISEPYSFESDPFEQPEQPSEQNMLPLFKNRCQTSESYSFEQPSADREYTMPSQDLWANSPTSRQNESNDEIGNIRENNI